MIYKSVTNRDNDVLKVHFQPSGQCWVGAGGLKASPLSDPTNLLDKFPRVRVAGHRSNMSWIGQQTALAEQGRLEVLGSAVAKVLEDKPQICISILRCEDSPGSRGGAFKPKPRDLVLYQAATLKTAEEVYHLLQPWYVTHPMSRCLDWIYPDHEALLSVLAEIVDPRLWIASEEGSEHSCSRLEAWFGMTVQAWTDEALWSASHEVSRRRRMLSLAWMRAAHLREKRTREEPQEFLFRIMRSQENELKGMVRSGQALLRFIRNVWMTYLYPQAELEVLLDVMWKRPEERAGFREALASMKSALP